MQHVLASFFSLKTTCQSDKNSSISIQLYLSAHKRLQNGLKKKKKRHKRLPFSLQKSHRAPSRPQFVQSVPPALRVPGSWLAGETFRCSFWMQEAANQSDAMPLARCGLFGAAAQMSGKGEGWDTGLCFPAEMGCFYLDATKVSQRN